MKFNDNITLDIARAVSDVLEGKTKKEEVKYPHKMYHPKTGAEVTVNDKAGHDRYKKLGYTHTPKEVAQPQPKGEKDFKDKHVVKKSGEKEDGTVMKEKKAEEATPEGPAKEESEKQKKYQAFFNKALKKFGVKSPSELDDEKKKEFFDYVDANYEADNEPKESVKEETQLDEILGVRIPDAGKDSSGIRKAVGKDDSKSGVTTDRMKDDDVIAKIQKRIEELEKLAGRKADQASDLRDRSEKAIDNGNDTQGDNLANQADKADDEYHDLQAKIEDEEEKLRQAKDKFRKQRDK
jgi:hypothetical protein